MTSSNGRDEFTQFQEEYQRNLPVEYGPPVPEKTPNRVGRVFRAVGRGAKGAARGIGRRTEGVTKSVGELGVREVKRYFGPEATQRRHELALVRERGRATREARGGKRPGLVRKFIGQGPRQSPTNGAGSPLRSLQLGGGRLRETQLHTGPKLRRRPGIRAGTQPPPLPVQETLKRGNLTFYLLPEILSGVPKKDLQDYVPGRKLQVATHKGLTYTRPAISEEDFVSYSA